MKKQRKIKTGEIVYRQASIASGAIDEEKRTVDLTFSSEEPYKRFSWEHGEVMEVLGHDADDVDMSRLSDGAPVLVNHDPNDHVGVVESAVIGQDKRGFSKVRFGRSDRAEEIFRDVVDGIRKNISVGYKWLEETLIKSEDAKIPTLRVKWLPMEISFASVPADASIGVGRSDEPEEKKTVPPEDNPSPEEKNEKIIIFVEE